MDSEQSRQPVYAAGRWEIDLARRELRSEGVAVPLGGRAFEIIAELVKSAGDLVTKNELMDRVWPGAIVEENALQGHITAIRKALGSDRGMLKTAFGRGYRLLGSWEIQQESAPQAQPAHGLLQTFPKPFATNLPAASSELIGRTATVEYVRELLFAQRLVTLVGSGGIGKTALAIEVGRTISSGFHGDVFLAELAPLANPQLVPAEIARGLGLGLAGNDISPESVARAIGQRRLLVILDNCEHLVDASARLTEAVINLCPGVTVLATSREALRVHGEYVYRVTPLDLPPIDGAESTDVLEHSAVQLFVARAKALGVDFTSDRDSHGSIVTICRRLDGIPLALELAAARAALLGPREVAALLDDRFGLLTNGKRTALPRHQTLRTTLDWSFNLLSAPEASVLLQLGIFPGDFSLAGAIAVVELAENIAVTDQIANLVAKSLVVADLRHTTPRYRLLDTTRAYALEKLRGAGEHAEIARRLADHCHASLQTAESDSISMPQAEWLTKYGRLIDYVRVSLDWAFGPEGSPELGVALTVAALPMWVHMSLLVECRERAELALAKLSDDSDFAQRQRMQLGAALGWSLMYGIGRARDAGHLWATTLRLAEELDDKDHRLRALWGLCIDQFNNGDFLKALEFARRFAAETKNSSDPIDPMTADRLLATTFHYLGDQKGARQHIDKVLAALRGVALKPQTIRFQLDLRVSTHYFLARILWLQGFADQALRTIEHNIEEGRSLGHAMTFCSVLGQAACTVSFLAGDFDAAELHCSSLLEHTERYPIRLWNLWARCFEGLLTYKRGDAAGLRTMRHEFENAGEARFLPRFSLLVGEFALALGEVGEVSEALATVNDLLTRCMVRREQWCVAELLRIKAELLLRESPRPSIAAAEYCFEESLELARRQGALFWELKGALGLARLKKSNKQNDMARALLQSVCERFTEGFEIADFRAAKAMLASLS